MFIDIDYSKQLKGAKLYLSKPNKTVISHISEKYNAKLLVKLGNIYELNFTIPYKIDEGHLEKPNPHIDMIKEKMLIKLVFNNKTEWFVVDAIEEDVNNSSSFNVTAYSLGYQLSDKRVPSYQEEAVNANRFLTDMLSDTVWKVGSIHAKFNAVTRSFDLSNTNVLDCIIQAGESFGALIVWDTILRTVSFVDFKDYGKFRGLTVNYGRLLRSLSRSRTSDELVTRLWVYGSDDIGIHNVNPTGQGYIEDFSYFMTPFERDENRNVIKSSHFMTDELCHAILDYEILLATKSEEIRTINENQSVKMIELSNEQIKLDQLLLQRDNIVDRLDVAKAVEDETLIAELEAEKAQKQTEIDAQRAVVQQKTIELNTLKMDLENLQMQLKNESNFTPELLDELNVYIIEREWRDDRYIDPQELYEDAIDKFNELREPKVVITLDIENLLNIIEEQYYWDKLNLGDLIKIKYPEMKIGYMAKIIEIEYELDGGSIKLTIANTTKLGDDMERLKDLLYESKNASTLIQNNKHKWDRVGFVEDEVYKLINEEHDANKRKITAGVYNNIEIGNRGIITKSTVNPLDVVIIQSGIIALSETGGDKWETALTPKGVIADRLIGNILIGRNLYMTNSSGLFTFDDEGFKVKSNAFKIETGTVTETFDEIQSKIEQTADKISMLVTSENKIDGSALASAITLTPNAIDLVSQNISFTSRGLDLTSAITQTPEAITMMSNSINLKGKVTFESFDGTTKQSLETVTGWATPNKTTIDGGKIETRTISASSIKTDELIVGQNIQMGAGAYITWGQISNPPTAEQLGGISSSSQRLTYIDAFGIYTGTVQASQFRGDTFIVDRGYSGSLEMYANGSNDRITSKGASGFRIESNGSLSLHSALTMSVRSGLMRYESTNISVEEGYNGGTVVFATNYATKTVTVNGTLNVTSLNVTGGGSGLVAVFG